MEEDAVSIRPVLNIQNKLLQDMEQLRGCI